MKRFVYGLSNSTVANSRHCINLYETELKLSHASYILDRYTQSIKEKYEGRNYEK